MEASNDDATLGSMATQPPKHENSQPKRRLPTASTQIKATRHQNPTKTVPSTTEEKHLSSNNPISDYNDQQSNTKTPTSKNPTTKSKSVPLGSQNIEIIQEITNETKSQKPKYPTNNSTDTPQDPSAIPSNQTSHIQQISQSTNSNHLTPKPFSNYIPSNQSIRNPNNSAPKPPHCFKGPPIHESKQLPTLTRQLLKVNSDLHSNTPNNRDLNSNPEILQVSDCGQDPDSTYLDPNRLKHTNKIIKTPTRRKKQGNDRKMDGRPGTFASLPPEDETLQNKRNATEMDEELDNELDQDTRDPINNGASPFKKQKANSSVPDSDKPTLNKNNNKFVGFKIPPKPTKPSQQSKARLALKGNQLNWGSFSQGTNKKVPPGITQPYKASIKIAPTCLLNVFYFVHITKSAFGALEPHKIFFQVISQFLKLGQRNDPKLHLTAWRNSASGEIIEPSESFNKLHILQTFSPKLEDTARIKKNGRKLFLSFRAKHDRNPDEILSNELLAWLEEMKIEIGPEPIQAEATKEIGFLKQSHQDISTTDLTARLKEMTNLKLQAKYRDTIWIPQWIRENMTTEAAKSEKFKFGAVVIRGDEQEEDQLFKFLVELFNPGQSGYPLGCDCRLAPMPMNGRDLGVNPKEFAAVLDQHIAFQNKFIHANRHLKVEVTMFSSLTEPVNKEGIRLIEVLMDMRMPNDNKQKIFRSWGQRWQQGSYLFAFEETIQEALEIQGPDLKKALLSQFDADMVNNITNKHFSGPSSYVASLLDSPVEQNHFSFEFALNQNDRKVIEINDEPDHHNDNNPSPKSRVSILTEKTPNTIKTTATSDSTRLRLKHIMKQMEERDEEREAERAEWMEDKKKMFSMMDRMEKMFLANLTAAGKAMPEQATVTANNEASATSKADIEP